MKHWKRIRAERLDLTDYVIHLTRRRGLMRGQLPMDGLQRLLRILDDGHIKAPFALRRNIYQHPDDDPKPTVRGASPAVCLTEQPLWALLKSLEVFPWRYQGYGIAYHKAPLFQRGGRPVVYGSETDLQELPESQQFRFVTYAPCSDPDDSPVDFTWEREWRVVPRTDRHRRDELELDIDHTAYANADGAIVVRYDEDVPVVKAKLRECRVRAQQCTKWRDKWPFRLRRVLSLETAERMLEEDSRYARIDTWPWDELADTKSFSTRGRPLSCR